MFSLDFLLLLAAGAVAGGFINGLAGFGTALFALGWWLQIMPPLQAVALVLTISVFTGIQGVWYVRHAIHWRRLGTFLVPGLIGIPIGLQILWLIDAGVLKLVIASFLLLYGTFFLLRRDLPGMTKETPLIDACIGFVSGILGAIAGLSGALPTMWVALRDWTKEQSRALLQPFNVVILGTSAVLLAIEGTYTSETLILLAIVMPLALISAQLGFMVFRRLPTTRFRRLLIILMFLSGFILMARELF
ncbi:MAG: sulfite exporter TauE/SafE family protein [Kiloniellales bacterium]